MVHPRATGHPRVTASDHLRLSRLRLTRQAAMVHRPTLPRPAARALHCRTPLAAALLRFTRLRTAHHRTSLAALRRSLLARHLLLRHRHTAHPAPTPSLPAPLWLRLLHTTFLPQKLRSPTPPARSLLHHTRTRPPRSPRRALLQCTRRLTAHHHTSGAAAALR